MDMFIEALAREWLEGLEEEEIQEIENTVLGPDFWDRADMEYERRRDGWHD